MDRTVYGARASASHLTLALDSGQCYCTYKVVPRLDAGNATVALRRPRMPSISDLPVLEVVLVGTVTTAADTPRGYPWHMKCCSRIKRREKQRGKRDKSKTEKGREKEEKRNAVQIYRFSHFSHVATHRLVSSTSLLSTSFSAADANARGLFPPATRDVPERERRGTRQVALGPKHCVHSRKDGVTKSAIYSNLNCLSSQTDGLPCPPKPDS